MKLFTAVCAVFAFTGLAYAQVLDREPPAGTLKAGDTVKVKSKNKCKSGVMLVTGTKSGGRTRICAS
jgi:hypothetical protein